MSAEATEIAYVPIAADVDLSTGDHQKIWDSTLKTITSQPGCKSLYWGRQIEHPDIVQLVIDWDSYDSHKVFMDSPGYAPFLENLKPLLAGAPKLHHVKLPQQTASQPLSAPVTECLSLYFTPTHSTSAFDSNFSKFVEEGNKTADEAQGIVGGWGIEEHKHENLGEKEGEEGPAKLFGVFVGWPSVEAHMKYRQTEVFPDVAKWLRDGPKGVQVHHVAFTKY